MNIRSRIAITALVFVVIWPFAHFAAARTLGASSWDLFSLGMYATPPLDQGMLIFGVEGKEEILLGPENLPVSSARVLHVIEWRWVTGQLQTGRGLAEEILAASAEFDAVRIIWVERHLNRRSAKIEIRESEIVVTRG